MKNRDLNARIISAGKKLFRKIKDKTPSVFNKDRRIGKVLDWRMTNEEFKTRTLRFVDVFPCLGSADQIACHIQEYFGGKDQEIPNVLKWGVKTTEFGGAVGASILSKAIRHSLKDLDDLLAWSKQNQLPISIRLVRASPDSQTNRRLTSRTKVSARPVLRLLLRFEKTLDERILSSLTAGIS
jgi:hypothetical protein